MTKNKTWFTKGDDYSIYDLDPFKTDPGNTDPRGLEFTQTFFEYRESLIVETVEHMLKQACPDLIAKAVYSKEDKGQEHSQNHPTFNNNKTNQQYEELSNCHHT